MIFRLQASTRSLKDVGQVSKDPDQSLTITTSKVSGTEMKVEQLFEEVLDVRLLGAPSLDGGCWKIRSTWVARGETNG